MTSLDLNRVTGITLVRKVILEFLQAAFFNDKTYTWSTDPNATKIEIVNEFATKTLEIEKYPKIVLTRGDWAARDVAIGRKGHNDRLLQPDTRHYQDLTSGTLILNVLSKSSIEAELIAEKVFLSLMAWQEDIKETFIISSIRNLRLGSIQVVEQNSDFRVFQVPVYLQYDKTLQFVKSYDYYDVELTVDGERLYQSTDFWVFNNYVQFRYAPASGVDIQMSYLVRDTLSGVTESPTLGANGERQIFPFSYDIYGPYYLISGIDITIGDVDTLETFYNYYTLYGDDITVTQEAGPRVHRQGHSYILPGYIVPAAAETAYIPPFYVSNAPGQLTKLASATYKIQTDGEVTCHILINGEIVPTYSGLVVNSGVQTTDADDIYLQDGDSLALVVAGIDGSPQNLSFTIFLDYIQ